uniref:Uncharacterized protein n=1 Tax=Timema poppense TaxID=170557 RepID=A0A7R9DE70_TIMPO|nr:unnamed protein product [Timema poppensis]
MEEEVERAFMEDLVVVVVVAGAHAPHVEVDIPVGLVLQAVLNLQAVLMLPVDHGENKCPISLKKELNSILS